MYSCVALIQRAMCPTSRSQSLILPPLSSYNIEISLAMCPVPRRIDGRRYLTAPPHGSEISASLIVIWEGSSLLGEVLPSGSSRTVAMQVASAGLYSTYI